MAENDVFYPGDIVENNDGSYQQQVKAYYPDKATGEADGQEFYVYPAVTYTGGGWDSTKSIRLVRGVGFIEKTVELDIDISELRAGDVLIVPNINGSITKHRVRRAAPRIDEPMSHGMQTFVSDTGGKIYGVRGWNGKWYRYTADGAGKTWDGFITEYRIEKIKEN